MEEGSPPEGCGSGSSQSPQEVSQEIAKPPRITADEENELGGRSSG